MTQTQSSTVCMQRAAYMRLLAEGAQTTVLRDTFLRLEDGWLRMAAQTSPPGRPAARG